MRRLIKTFLFLVIFGLAATWVARLPSQHLPWGALDLNAPIGLFTGHKLARLKDDPAACHQALRTAGIQFTPAPDVTNTDCPRRNIVTLRRSLYPYSAPVKANCALVAAMAVWEKQVVAPAAALHLSSPVQRIDHLGTFACRTVRGSSRVSQHATARAIDIQGFRLANGQRITVQGQWGKDTPAGRFLADLHRRSCPVFRGVLGPDYNALHADHFHVDMGPYNICR